MKEIKDIIAAYDTATRHGKQTALATVVHVEGSSYRRPGARMLITEHGELTGAISGGCLEGDALKKALLAMQRQKATLVTYDTTDEDDAKLGAGLGCNGIIHILIEPVCPQDEHNPVALLKKAVAERQDSVLVTLFILFSGNAVVQPGTCLLSMRHEIDTCTIPNVYLSKKIEEDVTEAFLNKGSAHKNYYVDDTVFTAFIEYLVPPVALVIAGAGNDAMPVVHMANILGWDTTLLDGRPNYASCQRFPKAGNIIVSRPEHALNKISIDEHTVFVLMTHNYNYDMAILSRIIDSCTPYIGVLGPKKKIAKMLEELNGTRPMLTSAQREKIHGPVGLDIGAETAEEIALSIVSEIKAVLSGTKGQPLKKKAGPIHTVTGTQLKPSFILQAR